MTNRIMFNNRPLTPITPSSQQQNRTVKGESITRNSFKELLSQQLEQSKGIKFSKHAQSRLLSRNIEVSDADLKQLENGLQKAADKGARDSLIMVNNVAYVVNVDNKTVITAVDNGSMEEKVFTNIDSAIFME